MEQTKTHWEEIYRTKKLTDLSWTEEIPKTSISLIQTLNLPKTAKIIDIGGGDSKLVDYLVDMGYEHVTVLDISGEALDRSKKRLGNIASKVRWIENDIADFEPESFDLWHDRAAFHFLTDNEGILKYINLARHSVTPKGYLIIGTFSKNGPDKCSGLPVKQYDEHGMSLAFSNGFIKINCVQQNHETPFNTKQYFTFCTFQRTEPII
jgi:SAM-dependent methyltransferase